MYLKPEISVSVVVTESHLNKLSYVQAESVVTTDPNKDNDVPGISTEDGNGEDIYHTPTQGIKSAWDDDFWDYQ